MVFIATNKIQYNFVKIYHDSIAVYYICLTEIYIRLLTADSWQLHCSIENQWTVNSQS